MADHRCPLCDLEQPLADPCPTCVGYGNPDYYVECTHLCRHGSHLAITGECCYRERVVPRG